MQDQGKWELEKVIHRGIGGYIGNGEYRMDSLVKVGFGTTRIIKLTIYGEKIVAIRLKETNRVMLLQKMDSTVT